MWNRITRENIRFEICKVIEFVRIGEEKKKILKQIRDRYRIEHVKSWKHRSRYFRLNLGCIVKYRESYDRRCRLIGVYFCFFFLRNILSREWEKMQNSELLLPDKSRRRNSRNDWFTVYLITLQDKHVTKLHYLSTPSRLSRYSFLTR